MASPNQVNVKILDVCQVTPSLNSPESATELCFPLTFFDIIWLKLGPTEQLYYYKLTEATPNYFNSVILPNLKLSLSRTLLHFLPIAGNITWPAQATKPIVLYTPNDGVSLRIAESDADFDRLSGRDAVCEITETHPYVPLLSITDSKASILALQITLFPNQGLCIAATEHHAFYDGRSSAMFLKAWAHMYKQISTGGKEKNLSLLPAELTPFIDRTIIQEPDGLDMAYLDSWFALKSPGLDPTRRSLKPFVSTKASPSNKVRAMVKLSREDIEKLRGRAVSQIDKEERKPMHLSTFVLAYAYVFCCIAKAKGLERGRKVILGLSADCRPRLEFIPKNYFGCCVMPFFVEIAVEENENGFVYTAQRLGELVMEIKNKGVLEGAKAKLEEFMRIKPGTMVMSVSSSPQFKIYEADFGWGRATKMEISSLDKTGSISMRENTDGRGGVEIGLVLHKHETKTFNSLFLRGLN